MLLHRRGGGRVEVRGGAHLERHPTVAHERGEATQLHDAVVADRDVVHDPDAVAQALGAAELERFPDGRQPEQFTGVDGDVEVLAPDEIERIEMARRPIAGLGTGDIEPDDAGVAPADRTLGDLHGSRRLAHGRHE